MGIHPSRRVRVLTSVVLSAHCMGMEKKEGCSNPKSDFGTTVLDCIRISGDGDGDGNFDVALL